MEVMRSVLLYEVNEVLADFLTCRDDMIEVAGPTNQTLFITTEGSGLLFVCTGELRMVSRT